MLVVRTVQSCLHFIQTHCEEGIISVKRIGLIYKTTHNHSVETKETSE